MSTSSKLSARERIYRLLDDSSFVEIGAFVHARNTDFNMNSKKTPADGVITGFGRIQDQLVYVYSQDVSVLGGTVGEMHARKIRTVYELALKTGAPVVGLVDCAGMRLQEATDALNAFGELFHQQTLASGVGDLKKVLSNVKTRGIFGEIQLGAILEELLAPEQYETNVVTKKGTANPVEYAIKLPGTDGESVYLPIDAKFPADAYTRVRDAYDAGDPVELASAKKLLEAAVKSFARDIRDKYINPPATTDFGIMFLPFEGLYAEVVSCGLVEVLQRDYKVSIAGPTTMAALLNSLQMGFRTLAIQKRSGEVWKVLGAVKTEFDRFGDVLEATQKRLEQTSTELDKLVGVRTRQIRSKLRGVTAMPEGEAAALLGDAEE